MLVRNQVYFAACVPPCYRENDQESKYKGDSSIVYMRLSMLPLPNIKKSVLSMHASIP